MELGTYVLKYIHVEDDYWLLSDVYTCYKFVHTETLIKIPTYKLACMPKLCLAFNL